MQMYLFIQFYIGTIKNVANKPRFLFHIVQLRNIDEHFVAVVVGCE